VVLPSNTYDEGQIGFWVAGVVMGAVGLVTVLRQRVISRAPVPTAELHHPQVGLGHRTEPLR
jgi:hypothetical protein